MPALNIKKGIKQGGGKGREDGKVIENQPDWRFQTHHLVQRSLGEKMLLGRPLPPQPSNSRIFQTFPRQVIHPLLMDQYPESVNY